jgi:hypothetical protein
MFVHADATDIKKSGTNIAQRRLCVTSATTTAQRPAEVLFALEKRDLMPDARK